MELLVDSNLFYIMSAASNVTKILRNQNPVTPLLAHIGMYYLLDCDYPQHYEVGLTALHFIFYESRRIPVDFLLHFNKIVKQYNNLIAY